MFALSALHSSLIQTKLNKKKHFGELKNKKLLYDFKILM